MYYDNFAIVDKKCPVHYMSGNKILSCKLMSSHLFF